MCKDLEEKAVLVIGGSRGIGNAAVRLAASAGARVAWTHLGSEADLLESAELETAVAAQRGQSLHRAIDCADRRGTEDFVEEVEGRFGTLDGLVYCAGYTSPVCFLDVSLEEWTRVLQINLTGAFIASQAVLRSMCARGWGSIVLIGSAAVVSGGGGRVDYVSAKAGLEGLNRAITKEFAPHGVRCNLVHPSLIETDLLRQRHPDPASRAALAAKVPLRRLGQPDDVAHLVLFLLSERAGYITGQSIFVDGGRTFCS